MRKTLTIATLLCALALPVRAEFSCNNLQQNMDANPDLPYMCPITIVCDATDVNLRSAAGLDSQVVGSVSKGDKLYVTDLTMENPYEGYGWAVVTTPSGQHGYINSKFCSVPEESYLRPERFRALFNSTVFFDKDALERSLYKQPNNNYQTTTAEEMKLLSSFIDSKIQIEDGIVSYGRRDGDTYEQLLVEITSPYSRGAGLIVGNPLSGTELDTFNKDMISIGWNSYEYNDDLGRYAWYLEGYHADGETRPVKGFLVTVKNDVIEKIVYCLYMID